MRIWQKIVCAAGLIAAVLIPVYKALPVPPEKCPVCTAPEEHAPCLLDIRTGKIDSLNLYEYSEIDWNTPAKYQRGGYAVLINFGDATGIRMTDPWYLQLRITAKPTSVPKGMYCRSCQEKLSAKECGFAILDVGTTHSPEIYEVCMGAEYSFRCYDISVEEDSLVQGLSLTINGTLELPDDNASYYEQPMIS